jgi:F-type H+-transporting ATPase subunit epsilon
VRLRVLLPEQILIDEEIVKVSAEAENGSFTLLPRHTDFATALVPGILTYVTGEGDDTFLAVDEGVLVKCGPEVRVSARNAVLGGELGELKQLIEERYRTIDDHEKRSRDALYKLEAELVRRFMEIGRDDLD